jgi:EAL domain-containing protein (putative c-di-GMP-specific phosphodiesterase class I)
LEKAQQLLENINTLKPVFDGRAINISASVGAVTIPKHGNLPIDLMAKADAAMSSAKNAGRNKVVLFDASEMARERMDNQLTWKNRLIDALEKDRLMLVYQPILSVASGQISHYEVLVRMRGDKGTCLPPDKFIPTAEQFGLIQRVDRVVVGKALRSLASLPVQQNNVSFSINLSGLSVGDPDMYRCIEEEINKNKVDPKRITFEITETAACEHLNSAIEFIDKIRRLGCKISLDDFGVGFSSFSYLKHLRADIIKIDGSFIRDIHNNNADQLFVKALVDVAHGMGMQTVAEFVENQEIVDLVSRLGVEYLQGYHIGRPNEQLQFKHPPKVAKSKESLVAV